MSGWSLEQIYIRGRNRRNGLRGRVPDRCVSAA